MAITSEIAEGNKKIALFMGAKIIKPIGHTGRDIEFPIQTGGLYVHQVSDLRYHTSWDWLMPAVKKMINADMESFDTYRLWLCDSLSTADINKVYDSLIDAIDSYNRNNLTPSNKK